LQFYSIVMALSLIAAVPSAWANTRCTAGTYTVFTLADPNAPSGNFGTPGTKNTSAYTIITSDSGGFFHVDLHTGNGNAPLFSNLYFDTIASTPGTNLGFQLGNGTSNAFYPNTGTSYSTLGLGFSSIFTTDSSGLSAAILMPNTFFLTNPDNIPFTPATPGDLVSLHLSQSFGYSVVGGATDDAAPVELGEANIPGVAPTPEPSSFAVLRIGIVGLVGLVRRKRQTA
jgi:hypothetical protein